MPRSIPRPAAKRFFAGALCLPALPLNADNIFMALALVVALAVLGVAIRIVRLLLQSVRESRRGLLADWLERKRLARQRQRIRRQSIVSSQASPRYRRTRAKGESGTSH